MSIGIYKYTNKLNGHVYIGQSTNIENRYKQHLYDSKQKFDRGTGVDKAIHKYGIENFTFEIIEECQAEELNEKERYWIQYYDSYNKGYNKTPGGDSLKGEEHPRAILTEKQVIFIRDCYANHIPRREVFNAISSSGITKRGFLKVWNGENLA